MDLIELFRISIQGQQLHLPVVMAKLHLSIFIVESSRVVHCHLSYSTLWPKNSLVSWRIQMDISMPDDTLICWPLQMTCACSQTLRGEWIKFFSLPSTSFKWDILKLIQRNLTAFDWLGPINVKQTRFKVVTKLEQGFQVRGDQSTLLTLGLPSNTSELRYHPWAI